MIGKNIKSQNKTAVKVARIGLIGAVTVAIIAGIFQIFIPTKKDTQKEDKIKIEQTGNRNEVQVGDRYYSEPEIVQECEKLKEEAAVLNLKIQKKFPNRDYHNDKHLDAQYYIDKLLEIDRIVCLKNNWNKHHIIVVIDSVKVFLHE